MPLDSLVLTVVIAAVVFYVLYSVIRAAVRDGILQADGRRAIVRWTSSRRGANPTLDV